MQRTIYDVIKNDLIGHAIYQDRLIDAASEISEYLGSECGLIDKVIFVIPQNINEKYLRCTFEISIVFTDATNLLIANLESCYDEEEKGWSINEIC